MSILFSARIFFYSVGSLKLGNCFSNIMRVEAAAKRIITGVKSPYFGLFGALKSYLVTDLSMQTKRVREKHEGFDDCMIDPRRSISELILRRTSWVENDPDHRRFDTICQPFTFVTCNPDFIYKQSFLHHIPLLLIFTFRCKIAFPTFKHYTPTLYFVGRFQPILFVWKILRGSFPTHTFW